MPPYSSVQKQQIAQFINFTQAKDTIAAKFLRAARWDVEQAIDATPSPTPPTTDLRDKNPVNRPRYFQSPQGAGGATTALNKIFDSYRDAPDENPDGIGIEGAMKYLGDIQVQLDEVACLGIAELLQSPSMGEFTREGFLNGWRRVGCDSLEKMVAHGAALRSQIPSQPELFRRVYRYAFPLCRMQGQRNLQFEIAAEQWRLFFTPENGGVQWNTASTPWLDWWIEFLEERGKRPINKDLWEQVEVFMRRTQEDEEFGWWSADGAWPGTLDDFVAWVQKKRGKTAMEVE
ncbi:DUF298 domain protein [Aspergillus terreus]|uniref:Defective in cullin neddylation protein n=1 Tax=Aspergillus terreus TaxID=33178 RepID=A0A5M3ZD31_ASPTE|nr:hypothetical protein ATETN484_0016007800 [Aspergillus terreus]GFF21507.1 DUF298 domain protein [Aspergillus terreus]